MRDHHNQTEFLKHCLGYDESARRRDSSKTSPGFSVTSAVCGARCG